MLDIAPFICSHHLAQDVVCALYVWFHDEGCDLTHVGTTSLNPGYGTLCDTEQFLPHIHFMIGNTESLGDALYRKSVTTVINMCIGIQDQVTI